MASAGTDDVHDPAAAVVMLSRLPFTAPRRKRVRESELDERLPADTDPPGSRSIARSRSIGKSTFTRWTSRPGRRAVSQSRCLSTSSEAESKSSSRFSAGLALRRRPSALVLASFACPRAADRHDADCFSMATRHTGSPRGVTSTPRPRASAARQTIVLRRRDGQRRSRVPALR